MVSELMVSEFEGTGEIGFCNLPDGDRTQNEDRIHNERGGV